MNITNIFNVGDIVKVREDLQCGTKYWNTCACYATPTPQMVSLRGQSFVVDEIANDGTKYYNYRLKRTNYTHTVEEDKLHLFPWTDEMFELYQDYPFYSMYGKGHKDIMANTAQAEDIEELDELSLDGFLSNTG